MADPGAEARGEGLARRAPRGRLVRGNALEHERCSLRLRAVAALDGEGTFDALEVACAACEASVPRQASEAAGATFSEGDTPRDVDRPTGVVVGPSQDGDVSGFVQEELAQRPARRRCC